MKDDGIQLNINHVKGIKTELPIGIDGLKVELNFRNANEAIRGIITILDQLRRIPEADALVRGISLRDMLVCILEEKFDLKVKVCGYCEHFSASYCFLKTRTTLVVWNDSCERWTPRKISR